MTLFKFSSFWLLLLIGAIVFAELEADSISRRYQKKLHQQVAERRRSRFANGYWGSWSSWSDCSRSCGTGVSTQFRECHPSSRRKKMKNISGGKDSCVGRYKRFQLCNIQTCPSGYIDIRREQCSFYNKTPFNSRYYMWEPYIDKIDSCTLNCRPVGLDFYATLNQTVIDGTFCGTHRQTDKICVGGQCMEVGCDRILASGRKLDSCGVCGGRNDTCRIISGSFPGRRMTFGYNFIFTLPPGAENVSVSHMMPSSNYFALREADGQYLLNGPEGFNGTGTFALSGTKISYESPQIFQGDRIYARGPLRRPIDILVFYKGTSSGIKYEYRLHVSNKQQNNWRKSLANLNNPGDSLLKNYAAGGLVNDAVSVYAEKTEKHLHKSKKNRKKHKRKYKQEKKYRKRRKRYMWIASGYTACSHTCGGGSHTTRVVCVKRRKKEIEAPPQLCSGFPTPHVERVRCNLRPCPAEWDAEEWSECSVSCGFGIQKRLTKCTQKISSNVTINLPASSCKDSDHLESVQVCNNRECNRPPEWVPGEWSKCSTQCSLGNRKRQVDCLSETGPVDFSMCKDHKPMEEELCNMGSCASDTWFASPWQGSCDGPCGEGSFHRRVLCSGNSFESPQPHSSSCAIESRLAEKKQCNPSGHCGGSWFIGPWTGCDAITCKGKGQQRRMVVCMLWDRKKLKVAKDPSYCKRAGERPADTQECSVVCESVWFSSEWSQCSASCGKGVQRRELKCIDGNNDPSVECSSATKPDSRQTCNVQSCQEDNSLTGNSVQNIPKDSPAPPSYSDRNSNETISNELQKSCIDRMKNCRLVYKARLCKLKYYNKLCCETCTKK